MTVHFFPGIRPRYSPVETWNCKGRKKQRIWRRSDEKMKSTIQWINLDVFRQLIVWITAVTFLEKKVSNVFSFAASLAENMYRDLNLSQIHVMHRVSYYVSSNDIKLRNTATRRPKFYRKLWIGSLNIIHHFDKCCISVTISSCN